jgi:hypothetical protein
MHRVEPKDLTTNGFCLEEKEGWVSIYGTPPLKKKKKKNLRSGGTYILRRYSSETIRLSTTD